MNAVVLGVSKDGAKSHQSFIAKQGLNFSLLSDEEGKVLEKYQAWGEKSMYGRKYMGIIRCTYIIDEEGMIITMYIAEYKQAMMILIIAGGLAGPVIKKRQRGAAVKRELILSLQ